MANQISLKPKKTNFAQMKRGLKKVAQTAPEKNEVDGVMQIELNEDFNNQKSTREQSSHKPSSTVEDT